MNCTMKNFECPNASPTIIYHTVKILSYVSFLSFLVISFAISAEEKANKPIHLEESHCLALRRPRAPLQI